MVKERGAALVQVSTSPYVHDDISTPRIMWEVTFTLVPVIAVSYYYFGLSAIMILLVTCFGCLLTERFFGSNQEKGTIRDGSALLTGILLALTLPPGFPLWMAFLGGVVAIGMGKTLWGGLGQNVFNPALLGRAFLQAAFPTAITTWHAPDGQYFSFRGTNLVEPFVRGEATDATSGATPLASMKFDQVSTGFIELCTGSTSGSLGETAGGLLLLLGIYLAFRRIINWRIPVGIMFSVFVFSGLLYLFNPDYYPSPLFMLFSGGLMLGAVYMATDLVTSPLTPKGIWIYALSIGFLVVLIRVFGGLPEGVMYAILLMNAATPLINRFSKTRVYGYG